MPLPLATIPPTAARTHQRVAPAITAFLLALVGGCDGGTSPFGRESIYVARTVNEIALPAPVIQHEASERILLADTIRFTTFGLAKRISVHRETPAGGLARVDTSRYAQRFEIRGDSLLFLRSCPPDAICVGPPPGSVSSVGTFSPDGQHLRLQLWYSGPVVTYERRSP